MWGGAFCTRLSAVTVGVANPSHFIKFIKEVEDDLGGWEQFMNQSNGVSFWKKEWMIEI